LVMSFSLLSACGSGVCRPGVERVLGQAAIGVRPV
jgi:hypothetical protein